MKDDEASLIAERVIKTLAEFTVCQKMAEDDKITQYDFKKYLNDLPDAESKIVDLFQEKQLNIINTLIATQKSRK